MSIVLRNLKFQIPVKAEYDIKCMKNILACVWQKYFMEEEHIVTFFN